MDLIYYISGFLTALAVPSFVIGTALLLAKPHIINNLKLIKSPVSRKKIGAFGITGFIVAFMSFGSVLAATEPASVKQARLASEAAAAKSLQIKEREQKKAADLVKQREVEASKPVVKSEVKTEPIAFDSTEQKDSSIALGERRVSVEGVSGERKITYDVTYVKGHETARKETKSEVVKNPITKITLVGTHVAPAPPPAPTPAPASSSGGNGYTNSQGNHIQSPSSDPAGASAQCGDGTYSYSQSRRGTCSHHGGVARWL